MQGDLLVVYPWYCGITFARYYHGDVPWVTVPPIEDHRYSRVDMLLEHMTAFDQTQAVRPVLQKISEALRRDRKIWLVGGLRFLDPGEVPPLLLPAPAERGEWHADPYSQQWSMQVGSFIQTHAERATIVSIPGMPQISQYENEPLLVVQGLPPD